MYTFTILRPLHKSWPIMPNGVCTPNNDGNYGTKMRRNHHLLQSKNIEDLNFIFLLASQFKWIYFEFNLIEKDFFFIRYYNGKFMQCIYIWENEKKIEIRMRKKSGTFNRLEKANFFFSIFIILGQLSQSIAFEIKAVKLGFIKVRLIFKQNILEASKNLFPFSNFNF